MAPIARIAAGLQAQRGYFFSFVPVGLAFGIGGYFALRFEPGWHVYAALAALVCALFMLIPRLGNQLGRSSRCSPWPPLASDWRARGRTWCQNRS